MKILLAIALIPTLTPAMDLAGAAAIYDRYEAATRLPDTYRIEAEFRSETAPVRSGVHAIHTKRGYILHAAGKASERFTSTVKNPLGTSTVASYFIGTTDYAATVNQDLVADVYMPDVWSAQKELIDARRYEAGLDIGYIQSTTMNGRHPVRDLPALMKCTAVKQSDHDGTTTLSFLATEAAPHPTLVYGYDSNGLLTNLLWNDPQSGTPYFRRDMTFTKIPTGYAIASLEERTYEYGTGEPKSKSRWTFSAPNLSPALADDEFSLEALVDKLKKEQFSWNEISAAGTKRKVYRNGKFLTEEELVRKAEANQFLYKHWSE